VPDCAAPERTVRPRFPPGGPCAGRWRLPGLLNRREAADLQIPHPAPLHFVERVSSEHGVAEVSLDALRKSYNNRRE
jgi:hypothetical protein